MRSLKKKLENVDACTEIKVTCRGYSGEKAPIKKLTDIFPVNARWNLVDCDSDPDLVVFHTSRTDYKKACSEIFQERMRRGFRCFILGITGEFNVFYLPGVDYSISYKPDLKDNYFMPFLAIERGLNRFLDYKSVNGIQDIRKSPKSHFCNFIYSNQGNHKRFPGIKKRMYFCKLLSQYKRVDCAGRSLNNTDKLKIMEENISNLNNTKINFMRDYKFSIAFENRSEEGYLTEKICHAYLADSIPIYWGNPDIAKFFNIESFINCHDYDNFAKVVERVKEIDNNPALLAKYINAPPILENSELHNFTKDRISARMDVIMEEVVNKREKSRHLKYPILYELSRLLEFICVNFSAMRYVLSRYIKKR